MESVRIKCFGENYAGYSQCIEDFANCDSNEQNRSRVKLLKIIYASVCDNKDTAALDGFFWNIHILDYSQTNSPTLHSNLRFRYLKIFNASHNELGSLSSSNFEGQLNLQEIDFSYNYITIIHDDVFHQNAILSVINLSHNSLQTINYNIFSKLIELKYLDLSFNQIVTIDADSFENNIKLETLMLQMNPLVRIDCHLFAPLRRLMSFDVSLENMTELDLSCSESILRYTSNDDNKFDMSFSIHSKVFILTDEHFMRLRYLNIAGNQLDNVTDILNRLSPALESLNISNNHLGLINSNVFEKFVDLRSLSLSNTNLSFIDSNPFYNQTKLQVLDISTNKLVNADLTLISKTLKNIIEFNIANNQIRNVTEILDLLSSSSLLSLDLSFNDLEGINDKTFQHFINLKSLNLCHTNLSKYEFSTFFHQNKLKMLDISKNDMENINFSLFVRKFEHLEVLNLESNRFLTVEDLIPAIFPKLNRLGLSGNQFTCEYLALFLKNWPKLHLMYNPTKNTHIDGIDCNL